MEGIGEFASTYPGPVILRQAVYPAKSQKQAVRQAWSQGCGGAGVCSQKWGLSCLLAAHRWRRCGCLPYELAPRGVPRESSTPCKASAREAAQGREGQRMGEPRAG